MKITELQLRQIIREELALGLQVYELEDNELSDDFDMSAQPGWRYFYVDGRVQNRQHAMRLLSDNLPYGTYVDDLVIHDGSLFGTEGDLLQARTIYSHS